MADQNPLAKLLGAFLPPKAEGPRVPRPRVDPHPTKGKEAFATGMDLLLGGLGLSDPLAEDATGATGLGSLLGMIGPAAMAGGLKRLYRVEPKNFGDSGAWLQKHLTPTQWETMQQERGRLFGDNLDLAEQFGHGSPEYTTYYVDVPDEVASAAKRKHSNANYEEYLLPTDVVGSKKPLPSATPKPPTSKREPR